jgi:ABC-type uncharacterized transport system substrate-binding protein
MRIRPARCGWHGELSERAQRRTEWNDPEFVERGALVAVGLGWYETGKAASQIVARVLRGEQPRNIPFEEVAVKKLVLNQEVARALGITFPPDMVQAASQR